MGVRKCAIKYCDSCSDNVRDSKISFFALPKNDKQKLEWCTAAAITKSTLKKSSYICEKHFFEEDIHKEKIIKDKNGIVIQKEPLKIKKLENGAIPRIFVVPDAASDDSFTTLTIDKADQNLNGVNEGENIVDTDYNIESLPKRTFSVAFESQNSNDENVPTHNEVDNNFPIKRARKVNQNIQKRFSGPQPSTEKNLELENWLIIKSKILKDNIRMPSDYWGKNLRKKDDSITFKEELPERNEFETPKHKKQVVLRPTLSMDVYILDAYYVTYNNIHSIDDVENNLFEIDNMKVCTGGPSIEKYKSAVSRVANKDITDHWRHKSCTFIVEKGGTACRFCSSLSNTLLQNHYRSKTANLSKVHIPKNIFTPTKRQKIAILKKAAFKQAQNYRRVKRRVSSYKENISSLLDRMNHIAEESLEEKLKKELKPEQVKWD